MSPAFKSWSDPISLIGRWFQASICTMKLLCFVAAGFTPTMSRRLCLSAYSTEKLSQPVQPVVFKWSVNPSARMCRAELAQGCFLFREEEQPLGPPRAPGRS